MPDSKAKNPFSVLGIAPHVISRLDNESIFKMVKACYRVLQLIHHPDRASKSPESARIKRTEQATEINLAYDRLNWTKNPESFVHYKEQYLKSVQRGTKKIDKLQNALHVVVEKQRNTADSYWDYIAHGEMSKANGVLSCLGTLEGITFQLVDVAMKRNMRSGSWTAGPGYKEIRFDQCGQMHYRLAYRKTSSPVDFVKLVGTIPKDKLDIEPLLTKKPLKSAIYIANHSPLTRVRSNKHLEVTNTIPVSEFKWHCLPLLDNNIVEGSYLFSIHRNPSEKDMVFLEGIVNKIVRFRDEI